MENTLKALAFILLGALAYHFLQPVFNHPPKDEQVIWGPQVYLYALDKQQNENLVTLYDSIDRISQKMGNNKVDLAGVQRSLQAYTAGVKAGQLDINKHRKEWAMTQMGMVDGNTVPKPKPPPPPCFPCDISMRITREDPLVLYHRNPVTVRITDISGKELLVSKPGSAGQTVLKGGVTKIVLDLQSADLTSAALLTLDGGPIEGIAQTPITIQ